MPRSRPTPPAAGAKIQGAFKLDSGAWVNAGGLLYFTQANVNAPWSWTAITSSLTAGAHTITLGVYVVAGTINFDVNAGGTFTGLEL